jgi:hypothetical protein
MSSRKLHHYFNVHTIKVLTNQPLNDIFGNRDSFDRVSKWETKLSEYVVDFEKCDKIAGPSRFHSRVDGAGSINRWNYTQHTMACLL